MRTKELLGAWLSIQNSWDVLPTGIGRPRLLPAIGAAEALQIISGLETPALMNRIASAFPTPSAKWGEDIPTYGGRIGPQLEYLVELLWDDPVSRQAVATVLVPSDPASGKMHNLCATHLQFLVRDGELVTVANMRSNDAWWGLPYDLFMFSQTGLSVANALGVGYGRLVHSAASMHLYERHWEVAATLTEYDPHSEDAQPTELFGIGHRGMSWDLISARARAILEGAHGVINDLTETEAWYAEQLAPYSPAGD